MTKGRIYGKLYMSANEIQALNNYSWKDEAKTCNRS